MSRKTTLAVLVVFALTGCATMLYEPPKHELPKQVTFILAKYDISLSEVERPAKAKERYGEQRIEKVQEGGIFKYYFEDEMVRILWIPSLYEISFVLNNKTDHSIKIVWDEAGFVDEKGISHGVMHSGVKYTDKNNPQAPTVIVRKSNVEDLIIPTDYVYWRDKKSLSHLSLRQLNSLISFFERNPDLDGYFGEVDGGWNKSPLLPTHLIYFEGETWFKSLLSSDVQIGTADTVKPKVNAYIGKSFQVLLPLQIEDIVNDYIFTFKVDSVELTSKIEEL